MNSNGVRSNPSLGAILSTIHRLPLGLSLIRLIFLYPTSSASSISCLSYTEVVCLPSFCPCPVLSFSRPMKGKQWVVFLTVSYLSFFIREG
ncbi:hypothetical protein Scep_001410 [Stephania cephalantha]|uniref:Uncharacterized protein n=1 Tax=Stephania cephalantha TaxID=152367 RepID=A0AAP0LBQ0_9MAGN